MTNALTHRELPGSPALEGLGHEGGQDTGDNSELDG